jgi:hypothetical protein
MLAPMARPHLLRHAHRFAAVAAAVGLLAAAVLGAGAGCGPNQSIFWVCLNPVTGKDDGSIYDANHYVNGEPDPCHCYDPCGPEKTCPIVVDAGPAQPGCDAGP